VPGRRTEGEGKVSGSVGLGLLSFPRVQAVDDKRKGFANPWTPKENLQWAFSLPWSVCKRERKRRRENKARVLMAKFQIQI
jgi:hypothetical protein